MDQHVADFLDADLPAFEAVISQLMSPANEVRLPAEALFYLCRDRQPDELALKLAQVLHVSPSLELRTMAAVLLRQQLAYIWLRITPFTRFSIKSVLLMAVPPQQTMSIADKLCDTVSELASITLPDDTWPELLPFLFEAVNADSPRLKKSALLIFSQLAQSIGDIVLPHLPMLHPILLNSLSNFASLDVRIAALGASINFVRCLSAAELNTFQDLLPAMMQTLTEARNSGNEGTAQEALKLLIELAGTKPQFFMGQLADVVGSMLQIAEAIGLEEGTRYLAVEFVITLSEARPVMMRKLPHFIAILFALLMDMLVDIQDDPARHADETDDEDAEVTSSVGKDYLDRLSTALGGNTIVPVAFELLPQYLEAPEWQKRRAALTTLAQMGEGCSKALIKNLDKIVSMVLNSVGDPHPRVRWAAIKAIGQLSIYL